MYKKISKQNKIKLIIITPILIVFIISGCKNRNAVVDVRPPKDPRTYSWEVDTLAYPGSAQTLMRNIWGNSSKDVYAVGHNDRAFGHMWHYDGTSWTDVKLKVSQGGQLRGNIGSLSAIDGMSSSNIWAAGETLINNPSPPPNFIDSSLIIHYDGSSWKEISIEKRKRLSDIYVQSNNNIWACGDTTIYHYDGVKWTREYVPLVTPPNSSLFISKIVSNGTTAYATGTVHSNTTGDNTYYFFKRDDKGWRIVQTTQSPFSFGLGGFWISPSGKIYSVGTGLFELNGDEWMSVYFTTISFSGIYGTSDDNIFIVGTDGTTGIVYHFNGQNWKKLDQLTSNNIIYTSVWTEGTEAFICGFTLSAFPQKTIVWHGK